MICLLLPNTKDDKHMLTLSIHKYLCTHICQCTCVNAVSLSTTMPAAQLILDADSAGLLCWPVSCFTMPGIPPPPPRRPVDITHLTATINSNLVMPRSRAKLGSCADPFLYLVSPLLSLFLPVKLILR